MSTSTPYARHLDLPSVFNLRDLGGYAAAAGRTVRWRRLFRSDGLQRLAAADMQGLVDLGIKTVVDLRRPEEVELARVAHDGLVYHNHSVQPDIWNAEDFDEAVGSARFLADRYLEMLDASGEQVASVLDLIVTESAAPLVFHCAAGKDRTGVIAALTLSLLGVADDDIAADYGLSTRSTERWLAWAKVNLPEVAATVDELPSPWMVAPPAAIEMFLADVRDRYGSVEAYAERIGVGADAVTDLREHLLEPAGEASPRRQA